MGLPFDAPGIRIYRLCIAATCDLFEKRERPLPADDKADKVVKILPTTMHDVHHLNFFLRKSTKQ